jgi:hypothetical protein
MTVEEAARLLFKQLNAPLGAINILAWYEGSRPSIRVWINPDYRGPFSQAIKTFHGYDVLYEVRGHFEAQEMAGNVR